MAHFFKKMLSGQNVKRPINLYRHYALGVRSIRNSDQSEVDSNELRFLQNFDVCLGIK